MRLSNSQVSAALGLAVLVGTAVSGVMVQPVSAQTRFEQDIVEGNRYCKSRNARAEHGQICKALADLTEARKHLMRAEPKYEGLRADAFQSTNKAIMSLLKALEIR
jgi:hypothetical protein